LESQYNLTQDLLDESMEAHRAVTFYGNLVHHAVNFYNQQYMGELKKKVLNKSKVGSKIITI